MTCLIKDNIKGETTMSFKETIKNLIARKDANAAAILGGIMVI